MSENYLGKMGDCGRYSRVAFGHCMAGVGADYPLRLSEDELDGLKVWLRRIESQLAVRYVRMLPIRLVKKEPD